MWELMVRHAARSEELAQRGVQFIVIAGTILAVPMGLWVTVRIDNVLNGS